MPERRCFLCEKPITGLAWEFTEGLAHPNCALDATDSAKEGWWRDYLTPKETEQK